MLKLKKLVSIVSCITLLSMPFTTVTTYSASNTSTASYSNTNSTDKRIRVDITPNTGGRTDMYTNLWNNWVVDSGKSAQTTYNGVTFKLSNGGNSGDGIKSGWYKGLVQSSLDSPTLTLDGVTVNNASSGGTIKLEISGLSSGNHTLTTWHSFYDSISNPSTLSVSVDGSVKSKGIKVPTRVSNDNDAGKSYTSFNASSGKTITVLIKPDNNGSYNNAVLNAFEIDGVNPFKSISNTTPKDGEEHLLESDGLSWTAGQEAVSHDIYIGTDYDSVNNANTSSSLYKGNQKNTKYSLAGKGYSHMNTYYWRVDEKASDGSVTKGAVRSFRIAHLAFPTAEGYGRFARGGRGGRVIEVTNLNDSGAGSLRQALEVEKGARVVVFRVGGVIKLKSRLTVPNDGGDVYVAGQTAPGDGITLTQMPFGLSSSKDTIIRDVRLRVGDYAGKSVDGMGMSGADHSIIDHCSISWSIDEGTSSRGAHNITFQKNIIAEALNNSKHYNDSTADHSGTQCHSFAASISGNIGSFHHNLLTNCTGRNWSLAGGFEQDAKHYAGYLDITNNVVYNYRDRTTDGGVRRVNFVNNYYKQGPVSRDMNFFSIDGDQLGTGDMQMAYLSGNKMVTSTGKTILDPSTDNWTKATSQYSKVSDVRSNTPFFPSYVTTQSADDAYTTVLNDVGATKPKRDYLDTRYIKEVKNGTYTYTGSVDKLKGIIDSQDDVGGYPNIKGGTAPTDSDHDGMPDDWENKHGLNPKNAEDRNDLTLSADGYTNLEMYLDELAGDNVSYKTSSQTQPTNPSDTNVETPAGDTIAEGVYTLKNVNSGLFMEVTGAEAANGTNVQQWGMYDPDGHNSWKVISAGNGYYKIASELSNGNSYYLDVTGGKATNGTNVEIYSDNSTNAQLYKFVKNSDGTYSILTKASSLKGCVEIANSDTNSGGNVQQNAYTGSKNQKWVLTKVTTNDNSNTGSSTTDNPSSSTPTTNTGLKAVYLINNWGSGYQVDFTINNNSSKDVSSWTLKVNKNDIKIDTGWNINIKEDGNYYVITPVEWNSPIPKGGSVNFGIQGSGHINNTINCTVN